MNAISKIVSLVKKNNAPVDHVRTQLMEEMQTAMRALTRALQKYEAYLATNDGDVAYSQMLFAEIELYRDRYYNARIQFETAYGNLALYQERLVDYYNRMKERNEPCLFRSPVISQPSVDLVS